MRALPRSGHRYRAGPALLTLIVMLVGLFAFAAPESADATCYGVYLSGRVDNNAQDGEAMSAIDLGSECTGDYSFTLAAGQNSEDVGLDDADSYTDYSERYVTHGGSDKPAGTLCCGNDSIGGSTIRCDNGSFAGFFYSIDCR